VIDGEVCALDERGIPRFHLLQNRAGKAPRLAYFVFNLLWLDGQDLRSLSLEERCERLAQVLGKLPKGTCIGLSSSVPGEPRDVLRLACASGLEGIVAKEKGSPYVGGRGLGWLKIKCTLRQEFALAGHVPLLGTRVGEVGGLLLALKGADGAFHFAARWARASRPPCAQALVSSSTPITFDKPSHRRTHRGSAAWCNGHASNIVGEMEFIEWTADSHVRHPSFQRLRKDKTPDECVRADAAPRGSADSG
jgi:bifunctional non-homologous end joining protein LigD